MTVQTTSLDHLLMVTMEPLCAMDKRALEKLSLCLGQQPITNTEELSLEL